MKKVSKGVLAAGLGVGLLVSGGGTLAYWTEAETIGGGTIDSGHMNLVVDGTNTGCGSWVLDTGESAPSTYTPGDRIVPGDVLTKDCAYTIQADGNHLRASVGVSAVNFDPAGDDFGGTLTAAVTAIEVNGVSATSFTEDNNGQALTATVTVTFDGPSAGDATEDLSTVLNSIMLTATQQHG